MLLSRTLNTDNCINQPVINWTNGIQIRCGICEGILMDPEVQFLCVDSRCRVRSKLLLQVADQLDHQQHELLNVVDLREELGRISHPYRQVLKIQRCDLIVNDIVGLGNAILATFKKHLTDLVGRLKQSVQVVIDEAKEIKDVHDLLFDEHGLRVRTAELLAGINKLQPKYLQGFLATVTRIRQEPINLLNRFKEKVGELFDERESPQPEPLEQPSPPRQETYRRFKNSTKNENDLIAQLRSKHDLTALDLDLLGSVVYRHDLQKTSILFELISEHRGLRTLKILLSYSTISETSDLAKTLHNLPELTHLSLALGNTKIANINDLGKSIGRLQALTSLDFALWSTNISDISEFGKALAKLTNLTDLNLQFGNTFIAEIAHLGKSLKFNTQLKAICLNLQFTKVQDISELALSLFTLKNIQDFELDLIETQVHPRMKKNFYTIVEFTKDWRIFTKQPNIN